MPEETNVELKKSSFDKKIIIIGLVGFMIMTGSSYFVARSVLAPFMPKEEKMEVRGSGTLIPLGEIIINVSSVSSSRYLKTEVVIETKDKKLYEEIEQGLLPIVRDEVTTILSSKTVADLDVRNRDNLKEEIKTKLNKRLGNKITNVYFDTFIMQ